MKRIYMEPQMQVVKMEMNLSLLAGSPNGGDIKGDAPDGAGGFSRGTAWDEEEDD
ncbi:MAG: hypothetical protein IJ551_06830 [Prevotella sp.]|nr:hypothetical protein [Prevotella sp.]